MLIWINWKNIGGNVFHLSLMHWPFWLNSFATWTRWVHWLLPCSLERTLPKSSVNQIRTTYEVFQWVPPVSTIARDLSWFDIVARCILERSIEVVQRSSDRLAFLRSEYQREDLRITQVSIPSWTNAADYRLANTAFPGLSRHVDIERYQTRTELQTDHARTPRSLEEIALRSDRESITQRNTAGVVEESINERERLEDTTKDHCQSTRLCTSEETQTQRVRSWSRDSGEESVRRRRCVFVFCVSHCVDHIKSRDEILEKRVIGTISQILLVLLP